MRNVGKLAALTAISIACAGASYAAEPNDADAAAQTKELNALQALDRKMLDARGTAEFKTAHDAFGDEMLRLSKGPDVHVIPEIDDSTILARMQSLGRQLGSAPRDSEIYAKVHEEFEILIKTMRRRDSAVGAR